MLKVHNVVDCDPSPAFIERVRMLMTPKSVLQSTDFTTPDVIRPIEFSSFKEIEKYREEIRTLKLVPIKNDEIHEKYNALDKDVLAKDITKMFKDSPIVLTHNEFPYWLPEDLEQGLVWIHEGVDEDEVISFIAKAAWTLRINLNDLIIFERPLATKSILVKGTFPHFRHIHFWSKR